MIKDAMEAELTKKAILARNNPAVFLEIASIFGDLKSSKTFVDAYSKAYQHIVTNGIEKSVKDINSRVLNKI